MRTETRVPQRVYPADGSYGLADVSWHSVLYPAFSHMHVSKSGVGAGVGGPVGTLVVGNWVGAPVRHRL